MTTDANGRKIVEPPPNIPVIEWANRKLFEKYCKAEGLDPAKTVTSPILRKIIAEQNELRDAAAVVKPSAAE